MRFVHYLQHWLGGTGVRLQVTNFVPVMHPIRQWADTFPWAALVSALELLKHKLGASDEDICHRLRTDFAVMYAYDLRDYQVNPVWSKNSKPS